MVDQRLDDIEQRINHMHRILETFDYVRLSQRVRNLEQTVESITDAMPREQQDAHEDIALQDTEHAEKDTSSPLIPADGDTEATFGSPDSRRDEVLLSPTLPNEQAVIDTMLESLQKALMDHISDYNTKYVLV